MPITSRVVNVIKTELADEVSYFTLEGVLIGKFKGGERQAQPEEQPPAPIGGGIVKSPTPEQVKDKKAKEVDMSAGGRLDHLKGNG
jgi:hypothetical protein